MSRKVTIVNYYGSQDDSRCGYCSQSNTSQSHGMWAHCMTVADYQDLIDRGWRRSGQYCYKPNNKATCCPSYTIKCDANAFHLSKSHKKVLKKMNNFLRTGQKSSGDNSSIKGGDDDDDDVQMDQSSSAGESSALTESKMITSNQPKVSIDLDNVLELIEKAENCIETATSSSAITVNTQPENSSNRGTSNCNDKLKNESNKRGVYTGPDPTKPLQPKAKLLRQQRKAEKLLAKTKTDTVEAIPVKKTPKNLEKNLKAFINEMPEINGKHTLKVKLVPSHAASTEAALNLYRRYQVGIHKDPPEKITRKNFENFLIRSPLQLILVNVESDAFKCTQNTAFDLYTKYQTKVHHDPPSDLNEFIDFLCNSPIKHETAVDGPESGYGSFHQQYWLDDKLIAVGVIDILPKCVSSVYFFYDPDYNFLTLGTYGTMREIQFIQKLSEDCPQLSEYYMGFYIHTCPKMRYKGKLQPSYLLCPEFYTWHLLDDDILKLLDQSKYSRFNMNADAKDLNEFKSENDLNHLRLLVDYKYSLTYSDYKAYKCTDGTDSDEDECEKFSEYGQLVGNVLSRRLYLVT